MSNNIDCHPTTVLDDLLSFIDTLEGNSEKPNNHTEGLEEAAWKYCEFTLNGETLHDEGKYDGFQAGAEWRDRQLNWARDLVQAGIDNPEEAVNILKRLKELLP